MADWRPGRPERDLLKPASFILIQYAVFIVGSVIVAGVYMWLAGADFLRALLIGLGSTLIVGILFLRRLIGWETIGLMALTFVILLYIAW